MLRQCYGGKRWPGARTRCCRATLLAVLSVAAIVSAAGANPWAKGTPDDVKAMLENKEFQEVLFLSKGVNPNCAPIVYLVLNHETLEWNVYRSKPPRQGKARGREAPPAVVTKDMDALPGSDGNPRVVRSRDEQPVLIVVQTNPFLYSYEGTVSPPQYSPDAAAMQTALSAIGSANLVIVKDITRALRIPSKDELRREDQEDVDQALNALAELVAECELVQGYVRRLETGGDENVMQPSLESVAGVAKNGLVALDEFERIAEKLPKPRSCYQVWGPLVKMTALANIKKEDLAAARVEMLKTNVQSDHRCEEEAKKAFCMLEDLGNTVDPHSDHSDHKEQQRILSDLIKDWITRVALVSDNVLSAKKDFLAAAAQLEAFVRIGRTRALLPQTEGDWTWPLTGKVVVLAPPFPSQTWLQDNLGTLSIKPDTSVYPECPRLKPTGIDKKFLLVSHREPFLGYGFGLAAFKTIVDPTFGAINPPPVTPPPTGTPQPPLKIARTAEDSRWGTIVAMVFLRARPLLCRNAQPKPFEPGLEFGFGLNSLKKTSLFLGASFEFHRFVRLGIGTTCQVITRLADGLTEGTEVVATADVRTQPTWKWRLYVGLTFALDALLPSSPSK